MFVVAPHSDPLIARAMDINLRFTEALPNFICKQKMTRKESRDHGQKWRTRDVIEAEIILVDGIEDYRNLRVNDRPATIAEAEAGGSWSTGEFAQMLRNILHPAIHAEFSPAGPSVVRGRETVQYDFKISKQNSRWFLEFGSVKYRPAYEGRIWIDEGNARVMRIEMAALNLPTSVPASSVETDLEYDWVDIGAQQHLLPAASANLMCNSGRNQNMCNLNEISFTEYNKFGAESAMTFGGEEVVTEAEPAVEEPHVDEPDPPEVPDAPIERPTLRRKR